MAQLWLGSVEFVCYLWGTHNCFKLELHVDKLRIMEITFKAFNPTRRLNRIDDELSVFKTDSDQV